MMKGLKKSLAVVLLIQLVAYACSWDNEVDLYPELSSCDTLIVSFQNDVVPILSSSCYTCHSNMNAPDFAFGISFEDYEDVVEGSSLILGAIKHEEGYPAMPKGAAQLDTCSISKIEAWVNAGVPDN
jgi:hypothetical protein